MAAFIFSLIGGVITLAVGLTSVNSWLGLYSEVGAGFSYSTLGLGDIASGEAIVSFILEAVCGVLIVAGAAIVYQGKSSRVRVGSVLVLTASIVTVPMWFGMIIGGVLSSVGAALGLTWKPLNEATSPLPS